MGNLIRHGNKKKLIFGTLKGVFLQKTPTSATKLLRVLIVALLRRRRFSSAHTRSTKLRVALALVGAHAVVASLAFAKASTRPLASAAGDAEAIARAPNADSRLIPAPSAGRCLLCGRCVLCGLA